MAHSLMRVMNMNEYSLDGFEQIWARVQGTEPVEVPEPTRPDADAALLRMLEQEAECAAFERCLAERRANLEPLHRETCERFQALRALWFLRTGERFSLRRKCCTLKGPLLQDLRKDYLNTVERAGQLAAFVEETDDPELRETFAALSLMNARHAERLKAIIRRVLDSGG